MISIDLPPQVTPRGVLSPKIDVLWDGWYADSGGEIMAEGVNVRFTGELQRFIQERTGDSGLYSSASEYIRDLVRRDYLREEQRKWHWLRNELRPGMEASESEFEPLDVDSLLSEAKDRRRMRGS